MNIHTLAIRTQPALSPMPCEKCTVVLEAPEACTLSDLASAILDSMGFENDHAYGFYDNLRRPYKSNISYTLFADEDDQSAGSVSGATVGEVFYEKGIKMMFLFDYGDDWHFLVTTKKVEPAKTNIDVIIEVSLTGTPPDQYPNFG